MGRPRVLRPQLRRDSLGAQPGPRVRISHITTLAVAVASCQSPSTARPSPTPLDSATAVALAMAAVADTSDTLVYWSVAEYNRTKDGYVIYISPRIKPQYSGPLPNGRYLIINDGGGRVYIKNNGKISLIEVY